MLTDWIAQVAERGPSTKKPNPGGWYSALLERSVFCGQAPGIMLQPPIGTRIDVTGDQ
jgi:hypothetical protein